jgi:tetratricopeptide (TPR) repeat protein
MKTLFKMITSASLFLLLLTGHLNAQEEDSEADIDTLYAEANRHAQRGRFDEAMDYYRRVAALDPNWADLWYNMGEVSRVVEDGSNCINYFLRYLQLVPGAVDEVEVNAKISECVEYLEENTANLQITTTPSTARIHLNGLELGIGQFGPRTLATGEYEIVITKYDHITENRNIQLEQGMDENLNIVLTEEILFGTLRIISNIEDATVTIGEENTTALSSPLTEPIQLQVGRHLITLSREGYYDWVRRIDINRDNENILEVNMQPLISE